MPVAAKISEELKIPENVTVEIEKNKITVKSSKCILTKEFSESRIKIERKDNSIFLTSTLPGKKEKALLGTYTAHIRNMLKGVTEGFCYEMKVVYSHFPIKTVVKGGEFIIENFLGEHLPRKATVVGDTKIEIKGDTITLTGADIENVSQTAANIELATKIRNRDPKVFQDGIYITKKG